jgi:hypothetical protein
MDPHAAAAPEPGCLIDDPFFVTGIPNWLIVVRG